LVWQKYLYSLHCKQEQTGTESMASTHSKRPLSPHLQVYKPQISSVMSITHRITGVALSVGTLLLVAWLYAAAYSADYFAFWQNLMGQWYGQVALTTWTFALFYHLGNGIRHLFWDMGRGFDLKNMTRSGIVVIVFAFIMTAFVWSSAMDKVAYGL